ncbi:hypothetical protein B0H12DRAFT_1173827 [Mycena haematopus]|nr:hypothetical protein B0H12DRAFT_1173827 [Mycena haematopus]
MATLEPKTSSSPSDTITAMDTRATPSRAPFLNFLPPWVADPLKSPRAWKVLLRCWIAVFASFVILLPNASLRTVGTTSFFAILASLFLPPYLPVQLTIFLLSTLMIGLVSGWGIGIAAMRAANAVRDQAHIEAVVGQIQASIKANPVFQANPALAQTTAIFTGAFLDIRASAVYAGFMIAGNLIFGLIRAYAPKLLFLSIFGTIAVDIFCTVGPLFPTKRYTLLNSTAISISCYMAIAVITTIFVFPETMCHAQMDTLVDQLGRLQTLVEMQDEVLIAKPEDLTQEAPLIARFKTLRALVITTQRQLAATAGMLSLEFSWGRWNGDDLRSLEEPTITLITRVSTFLNFDRLASTSLASPAPADADSGATTFADKRWHETYLLRVIHTRHTALEETHGVRPADIFPVLDAATRELRGAIVATLGAIRAQIAHVNRTRWRRDAAGTAACAEALDAAGVRLAAALADFNSERRMELLAPFLPLVEAAVAASEDGKPVGELPLRSLFVSCVFFANIGSSAEAVQGLLSAVLEIDAKRPKARLWGPTAIGSLWKLIRARGDKADGAFGEDTSPPVAEITAVDKEYRKDPDSRPPTNAIQRFMGSMYNIYLWMDTAEAIFVFKYVFISVALWVPAAIQSSAHFYYVEKGIWALIMAQTTLNIYAADQIFNYVTRLGGTLLGLGLGLIAWYAGNGRGNGDPYGAAVAFGVVVFPLVFLRVFSPEPYLAGNVMCCATFALVAGYSWIDGHTVQFATPGIGWSVAWKRWALVVVGSAASFIVMMLPPTSGRKAVRTRNANAIASLASAYGFLLSAWIDIRDELKATTPGGWPAAFRTQMLALGEELHTIRGLTELAKWEGSIRGKWPAAEYTQLVDVQVEMIAVLAQLASGLGHLEKESQPTYLLNSKVLNPNFIGDVMAVFSLISQSLRTGEPMHEVIPTNLLDRLFYHDSQNLDALEPWNTAVDIEMIKSPSYMHYASSIVAVYQLLRYLDELHLLTKDLCGEIPLTGFAGWREEYDRTHASV